MELGIETIYQYNARAPTPAIERHIFIGREPTKPHIGPLGNMDFRKMGRAATATRREVALHRRGPAAAGGA